MSLSQIAITLANDVNRLKMEEIVQRKEKAMIYYRSEILKAAESGHYAYTMSSSIYRDDIGLIEYKSMEEIVKWLKEEGFTITSSTSHGNWLVKWK
jgi:hypothetical protein